MFSLFGCGKSFQKFDGDGMMYTPSYAQISQDEAKLMMKDDDGHVIVDVRRADEYAQGHIPGAILIPNESITDSCLINIRLYWFIAVPAEEVRKHHRSWQTWDM